MNGLKELAQQSTTNLNSNFFNLGENMKKGALVLGLCFLLGGFMTAQGKGKSLVVYFSRADENYGVGIVKEGNTAILAKIIADKTGSDLFEIKPTKSYPVGYKDCCDVAKEEKNAKARPSIVGKIENIDQYDTIFIGYPIWWGDMPMAVYTFLESHNIDGKTIIPFCTHEGSSESGIAKKLQGMYKKSSVKEPLAMKGRVPQKNKIEAEKAVVAWLKKLGY